MKNQAYRMAMLYDFYGDLLTPRQKEFYDLYYHDDLSLAEIAENYDITRHGCAGHHRPAEKTLEDIEEKTLASSSGTTVPGPPRLSCARCVTRYRPGDRLWATTPCWKISANSFAAPLTTWRGSEF